MKNSLFSNITITKFQRFEFFLGIVNRMLIGFVTIYVTFLCLQRLKYGDLPWHALLCTLGFYFLMAEGILSYYKGNSAIYNWFRQDKAVLHITLQLLGSLFGIAGIIIRMNIDNVHFTTIHGKLGLAAFLLCVISLLLGLSALFSTRMTKFLQPLFNKFIHKFFGILTYTLAIASLIYGFDTKIFQMISPSEVNDSSVNIVFILKLATLGSLILTIYGPLAASTKTLWNYLR